MGLQGKKWLAAQGEKPNNGYREELEALKAHGTRDQGQKWPAAITGGPNSTHTKEKRSWPGLWLTQIQEIRLPSRV